jgi:hypothetical protein
VDSISILGEIPPITEDVFIEGYVTYTGITGINEIILRQKYH